MTENEGAARDDGKPGGTAGNPSEKARKPSSGDSGRGEASSADDQAAIDLDTAHDRAS